MIGLRIIGGLFAVGLIVSAARRHHRRDISRLNLIISWLIGVGVIMLAISPSLFNPVFGLFNFKPENGQRLTAVLMFADLIIFFLLFRNISASDATALTLRHLVEALAVQSFDWTVTDRLPQGERIIVVMPAHNEAENLRAVIHSMPEDIDGHPVVPVVVDDGSTDGTSQVARSAGALAARLPIRRGGGLALRVGYELGSRLGASIVVSMDADGQHVPDEMPLLVKPILEGEADMVNGSRVLGVFERESRVRHIGVHFFSWLVTIMTGSRITDVSNGYRAIRADLLAKLNLDQDQFWASELLIEGMRHRLRIREVPITVRARAGGVSKKPKNLKYGWNFSKAIVKTWLR